MTTALTRITNSLGDLSAGEIELSIVELGAIIQRLTSDVAKLRYVSKGDLHVHGPADGSAPGTVNEAMRWGTKLLDAIYYFALEATDRPAVTPGVDGGVDLANAIVRAKKRLLWTALFLMLRGSYPSAGGSTTGADIPAFLVNIAGMNESPRATADGIASFPLLNIPTGWVRHIEWDRMAPEIRQRLALGLAGYRMLGPFKLFPARADAPQEVKDAYNWAKNIASAAPDYAILSATRSPELTARLGSFNHALGNLILLSFTQDQINTMVRAKIIFQAPTHDPRADTWRTWATGPQLVLNDPIGL